VRATVTDRRPSSMSNDAADSRLLRALRLSGDALTERRLPWALIGGLAVSVRTEPRFTRDIDLAVAVSDDDAAEALIADLTAGGFKLVLTLEHAALGRLATVRLLPPGESANGVVVDLLFASSGIESEICHGAEPIEIVDGLRVPVAAAGHLVALKILARGPERPQDDADLRALLGAITAADLNVARTALAAITARGAQRGKDLMGDFDRLLAGR